MSLTSRSLLAAAALALCAAVPAQAQGVVIKMATLVPKGSEWHQVLQEMADGWQKASKGQVQVKLYPGGVAGDDSDVVRKMRLGTLNAGVLTITGLADIDRASMALEIPLAYADYAELDCALAKLAPMLEQRIDAKGFVLLGWTDGGYVRFLTKDPVKTPADLKKAKLFTWAGDDAYVELWKSAGFNPVPLPATELATGLQTGLINATLTTPGLALLSGWFNTAKHMTDLPWAVLLGGVVVNQSAWEKIPADVRTEMQRIAREAGKKLSTIARAGESRDIAAMQKRGLDLVAVDPPALEQWRKLVADVMPKLKGKFLPADALDAGLKARDECRAASKSGGR